MSLIGALLTAPAVFGHHGFVIVLDSGGANDAVDQSDLTILSYDGSHAGVFSVRWSWDKITFSGANTGDACTLFDTDGDGDINYSLCVQVEDNGSGTAVLAAGFPALFSCNDARNDRCGTPNPIALSGTTCTVSTTASDPFGAGEAYPNDTTAECAVPTGALAGTPVFTTVCSYPSAGNGGNNNPVDCVVPPGTVVADLNATLTDGTTSVAQGGSTVYTLTVRDPGPNHGHNAILQMPVATGITMTSISCAAAGGAVCPVGVTLAQLVAGVTLATFPLGSSLTFTIGANITTSSGSVTATATITPAAGAVDPTMGDNTATDTDSITVPPNSADLIDDEDERHDVRDGGWIDQLQRHRGERRPGFGGWRHRHRRGYVRSDEDRGELRRGRRRRLSVESDDLAAGERPGHSDAAERWQRDVHADGDGRRWQWQRDEHGRRGSAVRRWRPLDRQQHRV